MAASVVEDGVELPVEEAESVLNRNEVEMLLVGANVIDDDEVVSEEEEDEETGKVVG